MQRQAGDSRQEDLAKAAAAAVLNDQGPQRDLNMHSFVTTLGIAGHFCSTRKGAAIDSVGVYLSESAANTLPAQVEGVLRNVRSSFFTEAFIGTLVAPYPEEFGPNKACDLRNVHYTYAVVYSAGLNLGLNEHWGAHNEVKEFGSDTVHAVQATLERVGGTDAARDAFFEEYTEERIVEEVQESIASGNHGTLKLSDVEAWFVDLLTAKDIVTLTRGDQDEIRRIQREIANKADLVTVEADGTQDINELKATALADKIQPSLGAPDRLFVEALALERFQNPNSPDYARAYLNAKARAHFQNDGCNYLDDACTKLAPSEGWIATMLAEMSFLKNA